MNDQQEFSSASHLTLQWFVLNWFFIRPLGSRSDGQLKSAA